MKNKILTAVLGVEVALLIISASIALPIYFRPFYYMQINTLDIEEYSGFDRETIKEAYDEMITYCTVPFTEFSTGDLAWSEEGAGHFKDCKVLFILDGAVLFISLGAVIALAVLAKKGVFKPARPFGFDVSFISAVSVLGFFSMVAALASINFERAFTIFHKIMFPGKDNWRFHPRKDQIIMILPIEFFMNCAILIVSVMIATCAALIVFGIINKRKRAKM